MIWRPVKNHNRAHAFQGGALASVCGKANLSRTIDLGSEPKRPLCLNGLRKRSAGDDVEMLVVVAQKHRDAVLAFLEGLGDAA